MLLTGTTTTLDFSPITNALSNAISADEIISIIATGLGVAGSFVVLWWGSRKLVTMIMNAFKSGHIEF